jgi:hypothetical protein
VSDDIWKRLAAAGIKTSAYIYQCESDECKKRSRDVSDDITIAYSVNKNHVYHKGCPQRYCYDCLYYGDER